MQEKGLGHQRRFWGSGFPLRGVKQGPRVTRVYWQRKESVFQEGRQCPKERYPSVEFLDHVFKYFTSVLSSRTWAKRERYAMMIVWRVCIEADGIGGWWKAGRSLHSHKDICSGREAWKNWERTDPCWPPRKIGSESWARIPEDWNQYGSTFLLKSWLLQLCLPPKSQ